MNASVSQSVRRSGRFLPSADSWNMAIVGHTDLGGAGDAMHTFDISDPIDPKPLGFMPVPGKGVHRMTYWEHPYVFMSGSDDGYTDQFLIIADLSDPAQPREVSRWWIPGMHTAAGEAPRPDDGRYFGGESFHTHTAMPVPGKDLLVVVEEATKERCAEPAKNVWLLDISDEENPHTLSKFPAPSGDFCTRGGRFGPHNIHESRPGTLIDADTVYLTYFNAGVRVIDITEPTAPVERGYCIPETPSGQPVIQMNDITVDVDGLIYASDRFNGGMYVMEYTDYPSALHVPITPFEAKP